MSAGSFITQNLLCLFANYLINSPAKGDIDWVAGKMNKEADDISRVQAFFSPKNLKYMMVLKLLF